MQQPEQKKHREYTKLSEEDLALCKRLQEFRIKRNISQQKVADAIGNTVGFISKMETGKHKCTASTFISYGKILKVPLDELAGNDNSLINQNVSYATIDIMYALKHADRRQQEQYQELFNQWTDVSTETREQLLNIQKKLIHMDKEQLETCMQIIDLLNSIKKEQRNDFLQVITRLGNLLSDE